MAEQSISPEDYSCISDHPDGCQCRQLKRLESDLAQARQERDEWHRNYSEERADHFETGKERDTLRAALRKYSAHDPDCKYFFGSSCDCGLTDALGGTDGTSTN